MAQQDKQEQKKLITEIMQADEKDGLYNRPDLDKVKKLAESSWEGCHHCDDTDKQMWINGFVSGYLIAKSE